jgi:alkane 1-monooxygenase
LYANAALLVGCRLWIDGVGGPIGAVGLLLSLRIVNGIAINTAHELGHKRERVERWPPCPGRHARGPGQRARLGESILAVWPRTVLGSLRSAWRLEAGTFRRRGRSPWTYRNNILNSWAIAAGSWSVPSGAGGAASGPAHRYVPTVAGDGPGPAGKSCIRRWRPLGLVPRNARAGGQVRS